MTPIQTSAFKAGGGFLPQDSTLLFAGLALTLALTYIGWALFSGYRGWSQGQFGFEQFSALGIKLMLMFSLLTYLLLK
jgi:integrating conjugative element protein (TIGR03758 family)